MYGPRGLSDREKKRPTRDLATPAGKRSALTSWENQAARRGPEAEKIWLLKNRTNPN